MPAPDPNDSDDRVTTPKVATGTRFFRRYVLERKLGRGGNAEVWLANDEMLSSPVALKFLPSIFAEKELLDSLRQEARLGLELHHPHIVHVRNFEHEHSVAAIAMEFVDGDTLLNLRMQQPNGVFEPAQLLEWMEQLCDALHYAHNSVRLVHRDLKPANLMVNRRGHLKVADFGISMPVAETVRQTTGKKFNGGTLCYMSPEQLEGQAPKPLHDIYSLGATLYELITGKPPYFRGDIVFQIVDPHRTPPSMTERRKELERSGEPIPHHWEEVIAACLAKNPDDRPQTVRDVLDGLRGTSTPPPPPPPAPPAPVPMAIPPPSPVLPPPTEPPATTSGMTLSRLSLVMISAGFFIIIALLVILIGKVSQNRPDPGPSSATPPIPLSTPIPTTPKAAPTLRPASTPEAQPSTPKPVVPVPTPVPPTPFPTTPAPTPVPTAMPPPPPVVPIPPPPNPEVEHAAVRKFIQEHLTLENTRNKKGLRDYDAIVANYAEKVETDDRKEATRADIERDKIDYFSQWPSGAEKLEGEVVVTTVGPGEWEAQFRTRVNRQNASRKKRTGTVDLTYHVASVGGELKITREHVRERNLR